MWKQLAIKVGFFLLGILGEFLKAAVARALKKDTGLADRLAKRAKWHAAALASGDLSEEARRERLWRYIQDDAKSFGHEIKENFARIVAELAVDAFKKELADQL